MNLVVLTGRLTRDPEIKYGQNGNAYCRFSMAVNKPFKKDEVDFFNCVAFGKTAELIGEYVKKGNRFGVQGNLQSNTYEVNGEKRTSYDVSVSQIEFLESKSEGGKSGGGSTYSNQKTSTPQGGQSSYGNTSPKTGGVEEEDDEFPF